MARGMLTVGSGAEKSTNWSEVMACQELGGGAWLANFSSRGKSFFLGRPRRLEGSMAAESTAAWSAK